jgi:hypothetical protein
MKVKLGFYLIGLAIAFLRIYHSRDIEEKPRGLDHPRVNRVPSVPDCGSANWKGPTGKDD